VVAFRMLPAVLIACVATPVVAQRLSDRAAAVRTGEIAFGYAARAEVCGNGRSIFMGDLGAGEGILVFSPHGLTMSGSWNGTPPACTHGPVQVGMTLRDRRVVRVWPRVGGGRVSTGATDLGTVSPQEAADYLLAVARTATPDAAGDAMLAAALADGVRISTSLIDIGRDRSLTPDTREQAVKWAARLAVREQNDTVDAAVQAIAADRSDHRDVRERAIRMVRHPSGDAFLRDLYGRLTLGDLKERVIRVLAESPTAANTEWIERRARDDAETVDLRDRAIRVLGGELHQTARLRALYAGLSHPDLKDRVIRVVGAEADESGLRWIETIATTPAEPLDARDRALRVLGEEGETAYLREVYPRLDQVDLQERVLRTLGERGGAENVALLRAVALDGRTTLDLRDRALREVAEAGVRTTVLVALYDSISVADLRDRLIRLLAERGDAVARRKLTAIVAGDPDPDLRDRARRELGRGT
jgi:hypothetical protein